MFTEEDLQELSNLSSSHFPDKSSKWLIRQREHLEALLRMIADKIADALDFNHQDLLGILTQERTQNQEIVNMADSIIELSEQRGLQQGIQQGIEQGARQTSIESTLALLNTRFPDADVDTLTPTLEAIEDLDRLKHLNLEAFLVESFRAFQERLEA